MAEAFGFGSGPTAPRVGASSRATGWQTGNCGKMSDWGWGGKGRDDHNYSIPLRLIFLCLLEVIRSLNSEQCNLNPAEHFSLQLERHTLMFYRWSILYPESVLPQIWPL